MHQKVINPLFALVFLALNFFKNLSARKKICKEIPDSCKFLASYHQCEFCNFKIPQVQ